MRNIQINKNINKAISLQNLQSKPTQSHINQNTDINTNHQPSQSFNTVK